MILSNLRQRLDNLKGRRDQLLLDRDRTQKTIARLKIDVEESVAAQLRIQLVAKITQSQLRFHIESPVTAALAGVFDRPYEFELKLELRRGKTEADMIFKRDGIEYKDLMFSGGGGAVDVAALGLQLAALFMSGKEKFLLLDEPLKHLKSEDKELEQRGSLMMKEIGEELGVQFLIISHIPEQQSGSDRVFNLILNKEGETQVQIIK